MEKRPFHDPMSAVAVVDAPELTSDWQHGLRMLRAPRVRLRELRWTDATSLFAMMATPEVARFISPPPSTVEGFEKFIAWTHAEREAGRYVCFGVVPKGMEHAVGVIQVRRLEPGFRVAEWGFAIGSPFWGSGIFEESARLVLDFAFAEIGVARLEARAAVQNGRGNAALRKLGARPEAVLRKSFVRDGQSVDQQLWAILAEDWEVLTGGFVLQLH
jgi:ribosomal-protein-alanine N-acetyltransferase